MDKDDLEELAVQCEENLERAETAEAQLATAKKRIAELEAKLDKVKAVPRYNCVPGVSQEGVRLVLESELDAALD